MILINRTIELLLYPPGNLILFALLVLLFRRWPRVKKALIVLGLLQVLALSMPIVSEALIKPLESKIPPKDEFWKSSSAEAIVVLGGGRNDQAVEYGGITTSNNEMERLRYAALLHRNSGVPILVTGGDPVNSGISQAGVMARVLTEELGVSVKWQEGNSHTTWENAQFSDDILQADGVKTAWLVTHAWHMPRSMQVFSNRKVKYIPAPHSFGSKPVYKRWMLYVPSADALKVTRIALHEWLGMLWYQLRYDK